MGRRIEMMKIPGIRGLLLLLLCIAIVSCSDTKTADPNVTLGDVYVPPINCGGAKAALGNVGLDITVPLHVKETLVDPQVCWVAIFEDLGFGDEVGDLIACEYGTFQDDINMGFFFNLSDGNYAVIIGITADIGDECFVLAATTTQGPKRMAVGGQGCTNPPKLAKIEYDCMAGYDLRGPSDTTAVSNMYRYARRRFDDGNVNLAFSEYDLSIPAEVFSSFSRLQEFLRERWELRFEIGLTTQDFFLVGIEDCTNRLHFFGDDPEDSMPTLASGIALGFDNGDKGNPGAEAIVLRGFIDSLFSATPQEASNHITVHELGHALFDLTDASRDPRNHSGGSNADCVMNNPVLQGNGAIHPSRSKFCSKCDSIITIHEWTGKR
jgi:hypothetical protein